MADTVESIPVTRQMVRVTLYLITILSFGSFNPAFIGMAAASDDDGASPQQYIILGLWVCLISLTFLDKRVLATPIRTQGLFWPALFLCYIAVSPAWSDESIAAAFPKAAVILLTSIAVWRLTSILSVSEMFEIVIRCMGTLLVLSAVVLLVDPTDAIAHSFRLETHQVEALWKGVWDQKQGLGILSANFAFLMLIRIITRRRLVCYFGLGLALVLTYGSDSRGGAIVAIATPIVIIMARRFPILFQFVISMFLIEVALALALLTYLAITGYDNLNIAGNEINLTERTYIWQYGIRLWMSRPWFGFGLNGFWTNKDILWGFMHLHGWVLNNHHSGYVAVLVETGLIGMGLFLVVIWDMCAKLRRLPWEHPTEAMEMTLGTILTTLTINFTETGFLRSTNFGEILFVFLMINVISPLPTRRPASQQAMNLQPKYV